MEKNISPEGRLLALIKDRPKDSEPERPLRPPAKPVMPWDRAGKLRVRMTRDQALKFCSRSLAVAFIGLSLYLLYDMLFMRPKLDINNASSVRQRRVFFGVANMNKLLDKAKDYSVYENQISSRMLFGQAPFREGDARSIMTSDSISESFALVGILPGQTPRAIIEDKKGQKVYYLNKGESFNGFTVEKISDGSVELLYEGKKLELFL